MNNNNLLNIELASHSIRGLKEINEDSVGYLSPTNETLRNEKGVVLVVADGVSSAEAGKAASEMAVNRFIEDYYAAPDTWSVKHAGQKILSSINIPVSFKAFKYHSFQVDLFLFSIHP